ncbi:transposase [Vibrio parahaemolyticus]|uniref:transposase n=1 Tax=Vibrio parahaemolyticus TaxID=670 RepID=UPI0009AA0A76
MYAYLFGSVCPRKGIGEAIVVPWVHKDIIIEHLAVTEEGRHAVVVMDGAGWHTEEIANDFKNVSVIKLSPYSPELNPIGQVWRWLRQPIFYGLRRHHLQSLRCIESVLD